MKNMKPELSRRLTLLGAMLLSSTMGYAQTKAPAATTAPAVEEETDVTVLSPFEVSADEDKGYSAENTLAGNRLSTELRDIGTAVTVINAQFMRDIQATNNASLLQYTPGTEVGNGQGNFAGLGDSAQVSETARFANPNQNTRVRGLAEADNSRDFFLSDIPWNGYNVDRVDLQRGPNSILFGLGSPAGIVNVSTKQASYKNSNEIILRADSDGTLGIQGNFNKVILPKELAVRLDTVYNNTKFKQDQSFDDDRRISASFRYEPSFLKKGSARTTIKGSYENGNISSNRPRTVPPMDRITPWFATGSYKSARAPKNPDGSEGSYNNLNRETFNPFQLQDDNTGRPNHGQTRPSINGGPLSGTANPAFNPWVGNFGDQYAGINAFYTGAAQSTAGSYLLWESPRARGIGTNGNIDNSLSRSFHRPGGVTTYDQFATNAWLPYYQFGLYKARSLTDPTIFDFYTNLIDGPNKNEWTDWDAYNISIDQTFMNDKFGFSVNMRGEELKRGQISMLTGDRQSIYIDFNNVYTDGTPTGTGVNNPPISNNEPWQDGTPNPNVGRPFISDSGGGGNNEFKSDRNSLRVTAYFEQDFTKGSKNNVLTRILGRHRITGLYSQDTRETDNRSWQRYAIEDNGYLNMIGGNSFAFSGNEMRINRVVYLGDSLKSRTTASGSNIPTVTSVATVPNQITARIFDSTWNAPSVNPAAVWYNDYYPTTDTNYTSTQSENPANYKGWVNIPINVLDSEASRANRNKLTTNIQKVKEEVTSKAIVLQSYFWDKAIITNFGYRNDVSKSWSKDLANNRTSDVVNGNLAPGYLDHSKAVLPTGVPGGLVDVISRSYSIVTHIDQLPFIGEFSKKLPVELSFFYNKSSNFQPASARVDVYGEKLSPPSGKTIDRGILIESRDRKYSLKINKFVTTLKDASSSALRNSYFIGASQAYGGNWANMFEYDFQSYSGTEGYTIQNQTNNRPANFPNPPGFSSTIRQGNSEYVPGNSLYDYGQAPGEDRAAADARERAAVAGWRAWQASVDPRFYAAWGINLKDYTKSITYNTPQGFTVTEDSVSKGYEIEFNANPTKNWRLTFNATKVEAIRYNVGGKNLKDFITKYENALRNTKAGDIRVWWGGAGNATTFSQWFQESGSQVGADWALKQLAEGTNVSELRKWRLNGISSYEFTEGRLKGFRVGGGVRWQSKISIGYPPAPGSKPTDSEIDLDLANPFYGPSEMYLDAWIGYKRKLSRTVFNQNIEWDIQLNVTNLGQGNELIPITVQPDGSYGTYRIAPYQYFTLTNSFKF
jgi:hypothetical protein